MANVIATMQPRPQAPTVSRLNPRDFVQMRAANQSAWGRGWQLCKFLSLGNLNQVT